jgi:hypothetical protein
VRLPLLPGETVLDDALGVNDEGIVVVLAPDQGAREWVSTLPPGQAFSLTAPSIADRTEVWTLEPGELWHVDHAGVVPIRADDARGPRFVPLSGETLAVTATRTTATEGPTVTVERVEVTTRPGERMQLAELELTLRASRGGAYPAALPPDSEGASVRVGRREEPIPFETGVVTLPLVPGVTTYTVAWQSPDVGGIIYRTPELSLATEANNVTLVTEFPADRWVLLLGGPALGPAVLYWGVMLVVLALGLVLARLEQLPLTYLDAVLLGLGLTLCNLPAAGFVAVWMLLFAFKQRAAALIRSTGARNAFQLLCAITAVIAVVTLVSSLPFALLGSPEMHIEGNGSSAWNYRWFQDHSDETLTRAWVLSMPLWVYRVAMLAWSLWLAFALQRWLKWGWRQFVTPVAWYRDGAAAGERAHS